MRRRSGLACNVACAAALPVPVETDARLAVEKVIELLLSGLAGGEAARRGLTAALDWL